MQVSNYILIAALEVYILLIFLSLFLLLHTRNQKKLIRRQQEKLLEVIQDKQTFRPVEQAPPPPIENYKHQVILQQQKTLAHYNAITGHDDIMSLPIDCPITQKIIALRYRFLTAEEAILALENNQLVIQWNSLEEHFGSLLPDNTNLEMELAASKKRIENLEKFKQLFFDMEKQWKEAQKNAGEYYQQLAELIEIVDDKAYFNTLLDQYHNVYNDVNNTILSGQKSLEKNTSNPNQTTRVNRNDPHIANEIIKLRNVAVDQHRIINQLQRKLDEAKTAAEKEVAIQDLQQQLQRQVRFVQEAETCVKLMEDELASSHEKLHLQEQELENMQIAIHENKKIKELLQNFALESKDLMSTIIELEQENEKLKAYSQSEAAIVNVDTLKKIQTDFSILQTQYADLEEKYLNLKLKG